MKRYEKRMAFLLLIFLAALAFKSLFLDPVIPETRELDLYQQYAKLVAPIQAGQNPARAGWYTYRAVTVEKTSGEGLTRIMHRDPETHQWSETVLPGQYHARVRGYLFYILPVRLIRVEGGLMDNGSDLQS